MRAQSCRAPSAAALASLAALLALGAAPAAAQEKCSFAASQAVCPTLGGACSQATLCGTGYCSTNTKGGGIGQGANPSYNGTCKTGPSISDVYGSACSALTERTDCQFQNPLLMNPRLVASNLRCLSSQWATDSNAAANGLGKCMLGPNRHGDACNDNAECASGTCSLRLKLCAGVAGGQSCTASTPDPCAPGFYCASGICAPQFQAAAPGAPLTKCGTNGQSCSRGLFCAGQSDGNAYCTPAYSVAAGVNTTLGPYMCASGNAYMLVQGATNAGSVYQCLAGAPALAGTIAQDAPFCSSGAPLVPGQTCQCAADNYMRVTTIGGVGLGARAAIWQNLYQCLQNAKGITGEPCQFDASDMEAIRYGSCAYYACFPHYVQLATTTGARFLSPPLSYFDPSAACEKTAARNYYAATASASCISIMGMDNWQCILGPRSLSVAATNAVITIIFLIVTGAYFYHMWYFRKVHHIVFPCKRLND